MLKEIKCSILGPAGNLEALLSAPLKEENSDSKLIGVVCHPHPLYEGTMHNKVVSTVIQTFHSLNIQTVRFNFRGVGKSEGTYGNILGEIEDLEAVMSWLYQHYPEKSFILSGFSFGSYIVSDYVSQNLDFIQNNKIKALLTIAPPIVKFPFWDLKEVFCPWGIIHGRQDEIAPINDVEEWLRMRFDNITFLEIRNATHFFHRQLVALRENIVYWLNKILL